MSERLDKALELLGYRSGKQLRSRSNLIGAIASFAQMQGDVELEQDCAVELGRISSTVAAVQNIAYGTTIVSGGGVQVTSLGSTGSDAPVHTDERFRPPIDASLPDEAEAREKYINYYIDAADTELGHVCCDEWAEECRRILRSSAKARERFEPRATSEQVTAYIDAAADYLGPLCGDPWVKECNRILLATIER